MSKDKSRVGCASPSPQRITNKTFFGLITKRSTKVEPQQDEQQQVKDTREMETVASSSHNTDKSFAKCQLGNSNDSNNNNNQNPNNNKNNDKSKIKADLLQNHISRRTKDLTNTKAKFNVHRHSSAMEAASGSLSLVNEMVLSQSPTNKIKSNSKNNSRHRSPHHNLLSHQFSLCCKADKKSMTPPVSVRYNSIPDVEHNLLLKREQSSLNWSLGTEQISLSPNSSVINVPSQTTMTTKTTAIASTLQTPQRCVNISPLALPNASSSKSAALFPTNIVESASAPESPVTAKTLLDMQTVAAHGSPSNLSALSAQSMNVTSSSIASSIVPGSGPIRPLAISACRSRLRLKLFPPGMELPTTGKMKENDAKDSITATSGMKRATTPQHMSSPNICTQRDVVEPDCRHYLNDYDVMPFMSHENLQIKKQSSGSGLARQSLLAAQMLSLIPTEKARER